MMPITPIVKNLLILNVLVFIIIGLKLLPPGWGEMLTFYSPVSDPELIPALEKARPNLVPFFNEHNGNFRPFQIISYMFTHADVPHIFFNMLSLYFMGPAVEIALGPKRFLGLYFISGLVALGANVLVYFMPYLLGLTDFIPWFALLGASGAVFGVVIAFATLFPERELQLMFPPVSIKAWVMAFILVGVGLYQGVTGADGDIAHFAHLGGALAGYILARHWKYK